MKNSVIIILGLLLLSNIASAQFGNSLSSDGVQDYVEIADNDALDLITDFTVECWVEPKLVDRLTLIRKGWCQSGNSSFNLAIVLGKVVWTWVPEGNCNYANSYKTNDAVINAGECTHISLVHSSTEVKIYVNNILVPGSLTNGSYSAIYNSSESLTISAYKFLSGVMGNFYNGAIDEIRFWNYKLSQQEIFDYSNAPLFGDEAGLIAYFDMEDTGAGTSLTITNKATASGAITGYGYGSVTSPVFIPSCVQPSGIEQSANNKEQSLYPNPANNMFYLSGYEDISYVQIYNVNGVLVKTATATSSLNISDLPNAVYMVRVFYKNGLGLKRIVKL